MPEPQVLLLVRFESALPIEGVMRVVNERADQFRALGGLQQKYYLEDESSGEIAGLYLWESAADLDEYRRSELRATIAQAYQGVGEPRIEVYRVLMTLRPEEAGEDQH
jgi:hypothetical protein